MILRWRDLSSGLELLRGLLLYGHLLLLDVLRRQLGSGLLTLLRRRVVCLLRRRLLLDNLFGRWLPLLSDWFRLRRRRRWLLNNLLLRW